MEIRKIETLLETLHEQKLRHQRPDGTYIDVTLIDMGYFINNTKRNPLMKSPINWKLYEIKIGKFTIEFVYSLTGVPMRALITSPHSEYKRLIVWEDTKKYATDKIIFGDCFSAITYTYEYESTSFVDENGQIYSGSLAKFNAQELLEISKNSYNSITRSLLLLNKIFSMNY